jgi:hypothetical protein
MWCSRFKTKWGKMRGYEGENGGCEGGEGPRDGSTAKVRESGLV